MEKRGFDIIFVLVLTCLQLSYAQENKLDLWMETYGSYSPLLSIQKTRSKELKIDSSMFIQSLKTKKIDLKHPVIMDEKKYDKNVAVLPRDTDIQPILNNVVEVLESIDSKDSEKLHILFMGEAHALDLFFYSQIYKPEWKDSIGYVSNPISLKNGVYSSGAIEAYKLIGQEKDPFPQDMYYAAQIGMSGRAIALLDLFSHDLGHFKSDMNELFFPNDKLKTGNNIIVMMDFHSLDYSKSIASFPNLPADNKIKSIHYYQEDILLSGVSLDPYQDIGLLDLKKMYDMKAMLQAIGKYDQVMQLQKSYLSEENFSRLQMLFDNDEVVLFPPLKQMTKWLKKQKDNDIDLSIKAISRD